MLFEFSYAFQLFGVIIIINFPFFLFNQMNFEIFLGINWKGHKVIMFVSWQYSI